MNQTNRIYMDNAATTPVAKEVADAMLPFFSEHFGNASSIHKEGQDARRAIEDNRRKIAKFLNANEEEIIFTGSGSESNNTAIKGLALSQLGRQKKHIITSKIEHHAVLEPCEFLKKQGFKVTYLDVDSSGLINLKDLEKAITPSTLLVSIMHANNEIGTVQDIAAIGKICKNKGTLFHTDAVQTLGKIPIDVKKMNIDFLSASAHKIYGPKGVGLLYIRKGIKIEPLLHGGGQEFGLRSSTENVSGIAGFGKAVELCRKNMKSDAGRIGKLRDMLMKEILKIPNTRLNGHAKQRLYNNTNFSFHGIEGESLVMHLDMQGIAASTGSACSTKSLKPSHVLTAIGLDHVTAHGSLRLSIGRNAAEKDIIYTVQSVREIVENLRKISPIN
ncbi:MAG: cysteine desulfurase NifS [archaeon]